MLDLKNNSSGLTKTQMSLLVLLRLFIGWHLLYEGIAKMLIPDWSSAAYLESSRWLFSGFFHSIVANPVALKIVDLLNIWGLTLIGLGLFLGLFARAASLSGILLLLLYYIAHPPFIGMQFGVPAEGHYLIVNKTLVEIGALGVIAFFPTSTYLGLDRLVLFVKNSKTIKPESSKIKDTDENETLSFERLDRRQVLKNLATVPVLGSFIYGTIHRYNWEKVNAITGATIKVSDTKLKDLKGELPKGKIGNLNVSRIILGGNLIGGWSHSRDLLYVSSLFKAYNTEKKVFETLMLAEKAGINTLNCHISQAKIIAKYKRIFGSKIQIVCQVHPKKDDIYTHVDQAIDEGMELIQIQGNCCDWRVQAGEYDVLGKCIDHIRKQGHPAGLGAHSIQALMACDKEGIEPDFYMKTLHHDQYWSAHPVENRIPFSVDGEKSLDHNCFHDNMFCLFPDETIEFMNRKNIPFMAFKVLAGGSIHPKDGFKFAFENGADFVCVGMFDYQIVDDINIALETLATLDPRQRAWCA